MRERERERERVSDGGRERNRGRQRESKHETARMTVIGRARERLRGGAQRNATDHSLSREHSWS